jgi:hypothetical protein
MMAGVTSNGDPAFAGSALEIQCGLKAKNYA